MERLLLGELMKWREKTDRKPLILRGARQVGKTWLLKEFGRKCFRDVCYINFEQQTLLAHLFETTLSPHDIIEQLSVYNGRKISASDTLIIFDEVQEMPRALTSLKYFAEEAPEYAVCCAGSLLGVALHEGTSFPVGKVDFLDLYPLSFREFLLADGEEMLVDYILKGVQRQLLSAYENDFSKHAPRQLVEKIRYVWDSIPSQLAKENRKFVYGLVREGARAREYEDALMWLSDAGEIVRSYNVSKPDVPLKAYADLKIFKVFLLDIGLLRCLSGLSPKVVLEGSRIFEEFKGALTEQFVCQELMALPHLQANYYWTSSATAEVDFLITDGLNVYPLECKAGATMNAKSLRLYRDRYAPALAIRASLLPYERNGEARLLNIPLYMLFALEKEIVESGEA